MSHRLTDYVFPTFAQAAPCFMELARIVRGASDSDLYCKIDCATTAARFAASMIPHEDAHPPLGVAQMPRAPEDVAALFERAAKEDPSAAGKGAAGPDPTAGMSWTTVLFAIIEILKALRGN